MLQPLEVEGSAIVARRRSAEVQGRDTAGSGTERDAAGTGTEAEAAGRNGRQTFRRHRDVQRGRDGPHGRNEPVTSYPNEERSLTCLSADVTNARADSYGASVSKPLSSNRGRISLDLGSPVYIYIYMYMYMYLYMYMYMHVCVCVCVCVCIYTYVCVCMYVYINMYIYILRPN